MMFLAVIRKKVIDVPFQAEIVEDLTATPPDIAVPEVAEKSHEEVDHIFLEDATTQIAKNINDGLLIDYYEISTAPITFAATLRLVTLKAGPRATASAREIVEIEANGKVIGSMFVEV